MTDPRSAKARAGALVDALAAELVAASHDIHARPELGYQERFASERLAALGRAHGLDVELGAFGLDTAFVARAGSTGPHVVVCCEYDALPEIGHGCGHNVIGTAGLGAGLALAALAEDLGGRVTILGTPAEELGGGGKIALLERGAFAGADVAMMVHPEAGDVEWVPYLANDRLRVEMHGTASHASSAPWAGVNALDAIVLGYQAVAALRQQLRPSAKVHGIITHGGEADNTIPAFAAAQFRARARTLEQLERVKARLWACFDGAARQTGCTMEATWEGGYAEVRPNRTLARAYRRNGELLGREFVEPELVPEAVAGSTDMGNVSQVVPSIHPVIKMCPLDVAGHSEAFARWSVSPDADRAVIDGAKALAMTGIDVWLDRELLDAVRAEFAGAPPVLRSSG